MKSIPGPVHYRIQEMARAAKQTRMLWTVRLRSRLVSHQVETSVTQSTHGRRPTAPHRAYLRTRGRPEVSLQCRHCSGTAPEQSLYQGVGQRAKAPEEDDWQPARRRAAEVRWGVVMGTGRGVRGVAVLAMQPPVQLPDSSWLEDCVLGHAGSRPQATALAWITWLSC